jgi:hypothetical protein
MQQSGAGYLPATTFTLLGQAERSIVINCQRLTYQLALRTPGINPWSASFRKQIRQMPNLRYTLRGRPQSLHRFSRRTENLGVRFAFAILLLLATGQFSA